MTAEQLLSVPSVRAREYSCQRRAFTSQTRGPTSRARHQYPKHQASPNQNTEPITFKEFPIWRQEAITSPESYDSKPVLVLWLKKQKVSFKLLLFKKHKKYGLM